MLLATSFLANNWLSRILKRRRLEGLNTTRPWLIINVVDNLNMENIKENVFNEDLYLEVKVDTLPSLAHDLNEDVINILLKTIENAYKNPIPFWAIISCSTGTNKSTAISKWISDTYLIPIEALYAGHNINTVNMSRKIYNALEAAKN